MDVKSVNSDSQGSDEPAPPGTSGFINKKMKPHHNLTQSPLASPSSPGMLQAKKKLRAFSIQKKAILTPITVPKPVSTGNTTVLIGKLSGAKTTPKPEPPDPDVKKPPKPPKPGAGRKILQENYTEIQKKNVAEIEDMKRKMELVELGIPLGLICPTSTSEKAMPTKAMPPIKSFLDPAKVDELIREAKKARAEGKNFKFELSKFLPDYDNPFQRKKDNPSDTQDDKDYKDKDRSRKDRRKSDQYEFKRHTDFRKKDDKDRDRFKDKSRDRDKKSKEDNEEKKQGSKKAEKVEKEKSDKDLKETDVNLNDYLVCDSWSLDTEDKTNSSSPKGTEKALKTAFIPLPNEEVPKDIEKHKETVKMVADIPIPGEPVKVEKLKPVIDSFKYELDSNEDEVLDILDADTDIDKFAKTTAKKLGKSYDSPASLKMYDYDQEPTTADDENFLESVINEIKQEDMSDISQDKGLVEYDMSPVKDDDIPRSENRESVTPELDDRMRDLRSQQSSYSDGYRSSESGYKSRESGYKSDRSESFRLSVEKDLDEVLERKMTKSTLESLDTWSFILKICQPLLFRHDRNKCYKETHSTPKLWYAENPRRCSCVKDRAVVYEELETCKMPLVDRVYGCDQIAEELPPTAQQWYPRHTSCFVERSVPLANEWESEEQPEPRAQEPRAQRGDATPRSDEIYLDREYQRFMQAVWPEVSDSKADTSRSTTPVKEMRKKKKADDGDDKKKAKKMKLSSEGWSQDSEPEVVQEKTKKPKEKERRKRKLSAALPANSDTDDARTRKRAPKRKLSKKNKAKDAKRRRLSKKYLRKLKEKNKKKKRAKDEKSDDESDDEKEKKKEKKAKKKKQLKQKKSQKKKKKARTKSTSSSSSSSDSSTESSSDEKKKKKVEKRKKKKEKKRKRSSDSTQSEELFDVNILNNIKTERLTDDEKRMEFSPRRHGEKPREIINVKELQNDFVGNNIHIKQERVEEEKEITPELELPADEPKDLSTTEFKEPQPQLPQQIPEPLTTPQPGPIPPPELLPSELPQAEETSQCSSQESISSKDHYEKDDSHLRPSSQNSNYSFNDVMASHGYKADERYEKEDQRYEKGDQRYEKGDQVMYPKGDEMGQYPKGDVMYQKDVITYEKGDDMMGASYQKDDEEYEPANYEMYEQMAMAYQSGVASQQNSLSMDFSADVNFDSQRIETLVCRRGEIKCDWRAGDQQPGPRAAPHRPSRWGLKPGEVNIVLTGGDESLRREAAPAQAARDVTHSAQFVRSGAHGEPVYKIESIANRSADSNTSMSYDEAYMDMYGASDRLQYGDCFSNATTTLRAPIAPSTPSAPSNAAPTTPALRTGDPRRTSTLDARIDLALKNTVLGEVATDANEEEKDAPEKGILVSRAAGARASKRVSFADGYTPGQDSDVEAPPKKKKKVRRYGCAWPCPAEHADHVPLWDALPPPPPPASPPPPPAAIPAPPALRAALRRPPPGLLTDPMLQHQLAHHHQKFDPNSSLPPFMPPEPPPGMINFHLNN